MKRYENTAVTPPVRVDVIERGQPARRERIPCEIDGDLKFSTEHLESYCLAQWEPVIFDALVVAAAVEFCDRLQRRNSQHWGRAFEVCIPVHDPDRWKAVPVSASLQDALEFLTGDRWALCFVARNAPAHVPRQFPFDLPSDARAVIPFSEGLDSRAVAGLMHREFGDGLIRVRLGTKEFLPGISASGVKQPFTSIPFRVKPRNAEFGESSARSRGWRRATRKAPSPMPGWRSPTTTGRPCAGRTMPRSTAAARRCCRRPATRPAPRGRTTRRCG